MEMRNAEPKRTERWIRGPALEVLVPRGKGVPFDEALKIAEQGRRVIASNSRMIKAIKGIRYYGIHYGIRESINKVFPCWTGTMTAYAKPGEKLGATIEYVDPETKQKWVFPVPKLFRGMKDVILVAEHPDYTLENDGENLVVEASAVDFVENFPSTEKGYYIVDAEHGIPQGEPIGDVMGDFTSCYFWRRDSRVGPVERRTCEGGIDSICERHVGLDDRPSIGFGAAVEVQSIRLMREAGKLIVEGTPGQLDDLLIKLWEEERKGY